MVNAQGLRGSGIRFRTGTQYSQEGYINQLVPALTLTYALRELLGIKGGEGKIWNADESMTYRYDQNTQTWTV